MHFLNLWTVYNDLLTNKYVPNVNHNTDEGIPHVGMTLMFLLYAFFYSLIEDSDDCLNGFRLWRERFPEEEPAIAAVEKLALPLRDDLRIFRNRLGFHGSRSRTHEARALELFEKHSGMKIMKAIVSFKALGSALLAKENAAQGIGQLTQDQVHAWIDSIMTKAQLP